MAKRAIMTIRGRAFEAVPAPTGELARIGLRTKLGDRAAWAPANLSDMELLAVLNEVAAKYGITISPAH